MFNHLLGLFSSLFLGSLVFLMTLRNTAKRLSTVEVELE
jgi:hypothetical protein